MQSRLNKKCSTCNTEKAIDQFYIARVGRTKDGYRNKCKACDRSYNRQINYPISVTVKICRKCNVLKPASEFFRDKIIRDGLNNYCKNCVKNYKQNYYKSDVGRIRLTEQRCTTFKYSKAKNSAKTRNLEFTLSRNEYYNITNSVCHYCGYSLPKVGCGLDRINNNIGYTITNVVPCCTVCNKARHDYFTYEEMVNILGPAIKSIKLHRA